MYMKHVNLNLDGGLTADLPAACARQHGDLDAAAAVLLTINEADLPNVCDCRETNDVVVTSSPAATLLMVVVPVDVCQG